MPKISELPLANKLKEEDYIPIVQDGVTKKVKGTHFVTEEEYSLDAFSPTIVANDKAMYKFGEGDTVDFSDSAYDGAYKSAILSGNTLVNLCDFFAPYYGTVWGTLNFSGERLKTNTKYLVLMQSVPTNFQWAITNHDSTSTISPYTTTQKAIFTTPDTLDKKYVIHLNDAGTNIVTKEMVDGLLPMLIEYQEGMENWDIPYFEGMQSVKMPVLKTVGKNLFNGEIVDGYYADGTLSKLISASGGVYKSIKLYLKKGSYTLSTDQSIRLVREMKDGVFSITGGDYLAYNFTLETDCLYVLSFRKTDNTVFNLTNIQLEESTTATTYEPYKSNILSTPSDLELGGIGNVQDTLNLMTGELTKRVYKIVFDESFKDRSVSVDEFENVYRFGVNVNHIGNNLSNNYVVKSICDKFIVDTNYTGDYEHSYYWGATFYFFISKDKLQGTASSFKTYITENPITFQTIYAEPAHKTVDLSGTPFGYKGGHIIKSSAEGSLLPKFEYEVAVSRGAQISQNTSTLIKHDEKITELLKKTAATYINQKAEIAYLLNMSSTLEEVQTIPFIEDDYVNDDCMVDSDMVMDNMEVEPEKEIIDNVDTLLINLIYDLIELNDTLGLSEKVELFRQSGLIDKHNYEIIKEKLNPTFKEEDYADINQ